MTKEEFFRAVGEVREDQIQAAETVKKPARPWRRFGALAACLALIVTVGAAAVPEIRGQLQWAAIVKSFNPAIEAGEDPDSWKAVVQPFGPGADSGGGAAAGGLDGSDYWTDNPNQPTHPDYSTNVEIGELSGPGNGETMVGMSACLVRLPPEEIFAQDTAIFRGTIRELQYFVTEPGYGNMETYYTRAVVEVTDSIRGSVTAGETYSVLWLGAKGYMSTSISGPLEDLDVGGEAIFMPIPTDRDTGWKEGDSYFCYTDLAEFYLGEGTRYVFADTAEGLTFDRSTYEEIAGAETLDDVAAYIRKMTGVERSPETRVRIGTETEPEPGGYVFVEGTQPAAVPAAPQGEPSKTEEAGAPSGGPAGALEMPGGAIIGDEE